jgi:hypothetical protein
LFMIEEQNISVFNLNKSVSVRVQGFSLRPLR